VLWQSLAERAKSRVDLLKNAAMKEQRITDLDQELKQVREAAPVKKKRLEDELVEEKRKAKEATMQFNTVSIGRSNLHFGNLVPATRKSFCGTLIVMSRRLPQP
jgi:trans-2-enoyl-CoA reductase